MHHYHNLLYISSGAADESEGLKQALSLARNNGASLKVLTISPEFPKEFPAYQKKYEASLLEQVEASIQLSKQSINLKEGLVDVSIELINDKKPVIKIIQNVLQNGYDLVIKEAESRDKGVGFKAIDMDLLRKCPTPVWLCRPIKHSRKQIRVAVAIDPENQDSVAAKSLSERMLELSSSLANSCSGELHIVSCWDYAFEQYLRRNIWIDVSDNDISDAILSAQDEHRTALDNLIKDANVNGAYQVHHLRGKADELIPDFVYHNKVDILVMGTVARAGILGFLIGNTAENIVQSLTCSLMALKPRGFISPVKAY